MDGVVVGSFTPSGTSYTDETTASFNAAAGDHTITFAGVDPTGADYTILLDQVSITDAPPRAFSGGGFESPSMGPNWQYCPAGLPSTGVGTAGISERGSALTRGNPSAAQGSRVVLIQPAGAVMQVVNIIATPGAYAISFSTAHGPFEISGNEAVEAEVDGAVYGIFYLTSASYTTFMTDSFSLSSGMHAIAFIGFAPTWTNDTVFLGQADLIQVG
jgi:hypothetical protein